MRRRRVALIQTAARTAVRLIVRLIVLLVACVPAPASAQGSIATASRSIQSIPSQQSPPSQESPRPSQSPQPSQQPHVHAESAAARGWSWHWHGAAFLNANFQVRRFTDFHRVESQNWLMGTGHRTLGRARLTLEGMASAEPFTLSRYGSSQVFQTGELFEGAPLVDYQHPHDVVMAASARLAVGAVGGDTGWRGFVEGGPVGAPAFGPAPFMHRPSAEVHPTSPLGHHAFDSTHVTHGVVTAGVGRGAWLIETSAFYGREPDDRRVAIDLGPLDSASARVSWRRGAWHAQASAARVTFPDPSEFTDSVRWTASVAWSGMARTRPLHWLVAFGHDRETAFDVATGALLVEGVWHAWGRGLLYTRAELLDKNILTRGGYHPPGFVHDHIISRVGAFTIGAQRQLISRTDRFSLGADATLYLRDRTLIDNYGRPFSAHVYLRVRLGSAF